MNDGMTSAAAPASFGPWAVLLALALVSAGCTDKSPPPTPTPDVEASADTGGGDDAVDGEQVDAGPTAACSGDGDGGCVRATSAVAACTWVVHAPTMADLRFGKRER